MRIDEIYRLLEDPEDGTFAGVKFSSASSQKLLDFTERNDVPNPTPVGKHHITLLFSRVPLPNYKPIGKLKKPLTVIPIDVKLWGEADEKVLVVVLDAPALVNRHKKLMTQHPEAIWEHDEYIPHVTLSYDAGDYDINRLDIKKLGSLTVFEEYKEDIEPDWDQGIHK